MLKAIAARLHRPRVVDHDARLHALRAGHPAVIEEVLLELAPRMRGWCYRRVGPSPALDDILQEALIELARALPSFEGNSSLVTYAYRICTRVVSRQRKRLRLDETYRIRTEVFEPAANARWAIDPRAVDPEHASIERQALHAVLACLARLPERRREAFILCELEGETPERAARMLGTTPAAVRSRLMHVRRELNRRLQAHGIQAWLRGVR